MKNNAPKPRSSWLVLKSIFITFFIMVIVVVVVLAVIYLVPVLIFLTASFIVYGLIRHGCYGQDSD